MTSQTLTRAARIIDPDAWAAHDHYAERSAEWFNIEGPASRLGTQYRDQAIDLTAPSLAKADAILSDDPSLVLREALRKAAGELDQCSRMMPRGWAAARRAAEAAYSTLAALARGEA
jgi:hypothetical protein